MNEIQAISSKIKTLPNRPPFMLDADLAMVYGTLPKRINEAVKRNPERFPDDFVFQLTKEEAESCGVDLDDFDFANCKLKTDMRGGRNLRPPTQKFRRKDYLPYGFTREGCNMLSAVLNTPIAVARSIQIMRAFTAMERGQSATDTVLGKLMEMFAEMRQDVNELKSRPPVNIVPTYKEMPMTIHRGKPCASRLGPAFQYPEGVELVMSMRGRGAGFLEIEKASKERWPDEPDRHISKSAAHRFWTRAKDGLLKEFGIDVTVH